MTVIEIYGLHKYLGVVKVETSLPLPIAMEVCRDIAITKPYMSVDLVINDTRTVTTTLAGGGLVQVESFLCPKCRAPTSEHPYLVAGFACACAKGDAQCHSI